MIIAIIFSGFLAQCIFQQNSANILWYDQLDIGFIKLRQNDFDK